MFTYLQDFQLEATEVYSKVAKQLVKLQKYSEIRQLLKCVSESGVAAKNDGDTIILNCLSEFKNIPAEVILSWLASILKYNGCIQYRLQRLLCSACVALLVIQIT